MGKTKCNCDRKNYFHHNFDKDNHKELFSDVGDNITINFLHNVGNSENATSPNVDIYNGNHLLVSGLSYKQMATVEINNHKQNLIIVKISGTNTIVAEQYFRFMTRGSMNYTITISGILGIPGGKILLVDFNNSTSCTRNDRSKMRVINASPVYPYVDIYIENYLLDTNLEYLSSSRYRDIKLGYKRIYISPPNTNSKILVGVVNFSSGQVYNLILSSNYVMSESHYLTTLISQTTNDQNCDYLQQDFNINDYMGKWFTIASIPQPYDSDCQRSTAFYNLLRNNVGVTNSCYDKNWNLIRQVFGTASQNPCDQASFIVKFPGFEFPGNFSTEPNYLVHKTNYKNYSLVGSPNRQSLWILSRYETMSSRQYDKLIQLASDLGYNTSNIQLTCRSISD